MEKLFEFYGGSLKKPLDLTFSYLQDLEKNQREFFRNSYELCNIAFPGEEKFWELQATLAEQGFKMIDSVYEKFEKVFNT
jgi:hypothetical protein